MNQRFKTSIGVWLFSSAALCSALPSDDFCRQLVDVNYQKALEPAVLELFEVENAFFQELSKEVFHLIEEGNGSIATRQGHPSNWTKPEGFIEQYSLLNVSGRLGDYSTDHNRSLRKKSFHFSARYPHLAAFIALFPHAVNFRINVLHPHSRFSQHQEDICFPRSRDSKPALRVRFHLPIATNEEALMLANGKMYYFEAGKLYFFHNGAVHDGSNDSPREARIHLLWDMLLTEDTFERMFQRSIEMPHLTKRDRMEMEPKAFVGIDPDYKRTAYKFSYEVATEAGLCPVQ